MPISAHLTQFLASVHPYDSLMDADLVALAQVCDVQINAVGDAIFSVGDPVQNLYIVVEGEVEITDDTGVPLSLLGPRNSFGERALLRDEQAGRTATVLAPTTLIVMPAATLFALIDQHPAVAKFFDRRRPTREDRNDLATMAVDRLMSRDPVRCDPDTPIRAAASLMDTHRISSICITDGDVFQGIVTLRDMNSRVVVAGGDANAPVASIMTAGPLTLGPKALVTDVLHLMVERGIGHIPIVQGDALLGIVTQTDLTRAQALSSADLAGRVAKAMDAAEMAVSTAKIPQLLVQLVDAGNRHEVVTRLITDIADTATRRLLALAETALGPAPVPYLWLACGSQGRQEQTGVSDQDNCLILSDDVTPADMPYFTALAKFVCDGLPPVSGKLSAALFISNFQVGRIGQ